MQGIHGRVLIDNLDQPPMNTWSISWSKLINSWIDIQSVLGWHSSQPPNGLPRDTLSSVNWYTAECWLNHKNMYQLTLDCTSVKISPLLTDQMKTDMLIEHWSSVGSIKVLFHGIEHQKIIFVLAYFQEQKGIQLQEKINSACTFNLIGWMQR